MSKRNIVHIEIPSAHFDMSGKSYGALFGWKTTGMAEMNATL